GRGPHVTRRSWSPLIYISRSISSKRVKPAIPFARRMPVLAVAREHAEDLLQELMARQLVDETRKSTKRGREILIPVVAEPSIPLARHGARWETGERLPSRSRSRNPRDRLDERLRAAGIPLAIAPPRWKRLGDVVILRILPEAQAHARALAEIYGSVLGPSWLTCSRGLATSHYLLRCAPTPRSCTRVN